jgi:Spy/CpxP family protein refolding chaperone
MKSPITRAALIAGAALSVACATTTFAQPAPGAPPAAPAGAMKRQHDPAQRAERLRAALQLRADQEPALQAFLGSMQPQGDRAQIRAERQAAAGLTTPQRLDRAAAKMAQRQQAFARHADATKRFYAALSPAQQKAFDAMHPQGMGGKGMKRGGRMGMGRGHAPQG